MKDLVRALSRENACSARDLGDVAIANFLPGDGGDGHAVSIGETVDAL
jgi:hypothetical protein